MSGRDGPPEAAQGCCRGLPDPDLPYQQGGLDGLCGLYSMINALRLAVARQGYVLSAAQCQHLFGAGIRLFEDRGVLAKVICEGMGGPQQRTLLRALTAWVMVQTRLEVRTRHPFRTHPRASHTAVALALTAALDRGAVVVVSLSGRLDHYTVIRGYSASRWRLYDSGDLHWLAKSACGSPRSTKRHRIDPTSLAAIEVLP